MKKMKIAPALLALFIALSGPAMAHAKRPSTATDCDPTSHEINPDIDYSLCRPGNNPDA